MTERLGGQVHVVFLKLCRIVFEYVFALAADNLLYNWFQNGSAATIIIYSIQQHSLLHSPY